MKKRIKNITFYMIGFYIGALILAALLPYEAKTSAFLAVTVTSLTALVFIGYELYMRIVHDPIDYPRFTHIAEGSNYGFWRTVLTIFQLFGFEILISSAFVTVSLAAGGGAKVGLYSSILMGLMSLYYLVYKMRVVLVESWLNFKNDKKQYGAVFIGLALIYLGNIVTSLVSKSFGAADSTVNQQMVESIVRSAPIYGFFL